MTLRGAGLAAAALLFASPAAAAGACRHGEMAWGGLSTGAASQAEVASAWTLRPPFRVAVILRDHPPTPTTDTDDIGESLWVSRLHAPALCLRRVLRTRFDIRPMHNLSGIDCPTFSPDGRTLYICASAWGTSAAVHAVNLTTGAERYVTDGNGPQVISSGPYRGDLLLARHTPLPTAGYDFPRFVVRPSDGRAVLRIPGTYGEGDDPVVARWLAAHGAAAR